MQYSISGEIAQSARLAFASGERAWVSKGVLMAYSPQMQWSLRLPGGAGGALRRSLSGEGIALTYLESKAEDQYALLAANAPGHLELWDLERDGPVTTTRGAFVAAWGEDIDITVTVARRAGAAVFGGAGLFLQTISGSGFVLVHGSGDFFERQMAAGEELLVSTGNLAAFSSGIDYDIRGVGGCRRMIFGGEGLFMTKLRFGLSLLFDQNVGHSPACGYVDPSRSFRGGPPCVQTVGSSNELSVVRLDCPIPLTMPF